MHRFLIAGIALLLVSCGSESTQNKQQTAVRVVDAPPATPFGEVINTAGADVTELTHYLKQFERPTQQFSVGADTNAIVKGKGGTRVFVVPDDLEYADGSKVGAGITVSLIELQNTEDLVRNGMPTVSNGRLLESGGSYYINLSSAGKPLRLKQGRKLAVEFPKKAKKDMQLFYGVNDGKGTINWDPAKETFRPKTTPDSIMVRVPIVKYKDTILADMEVRPDHKPRDIDVEKLRQFGKPVMKLIDGRVCFVGRTEDTTNQQYTMRKVSASLQMMDDVYEVVKLAKLGWINCDRFNNNERVDIQLAVIEGNIHKSIQTMIVFKDINGVIRDHLDFANGGVHTWTGLPKNLRAKILAFAWKDGKPYAYTQSLNISPTSKVTIDLKPVTKQDITDMISM